MAAMVIAGWMQVGLGQNLDEGLVAYYPFNGNANDESGNGKNLTVNGAALAKDRYGKSNSAYSFDGNDSLIGDKSLNGIQNFTESIWFKVEANPKGRLFNTPNGCAEFDNDQKLHIKIYTERNGGKGFWGKAHVYTTNVTITKNTWHHLVMVGDSQHYAKVYLDGVLIDLGDRFYDLSLIHI